MASAEIGIPTVSKNGHWSSEHCRIVILIPEAGTLAVADTDSDIIGDPCPFGGQWSTALVRQAPPWRREVLGVAQVLGAFLELPLRGLAESWCLPIASDR